VGNESVTRKVFWQDPYLTELDTRIARVAGDEVTVEATILYALSGGQESDCGAIGGRRVLGAEWRGREIVYTLESGHGLTPDEAVRIDLDWRRRYRLMRLHFAAELVLEIANRRLSRPEKIGAHIAEDKARIDFVWRGSIAPCLPGIAADVRALVAADLPIQSAFSDEENERRFWRVEGFGEAACGGTHLRRTGEVGDVALKRRNVGKDKERIEICLAEASGAIPPRDA
jgi:Ser-tRNA(Ala) deacylase AlaX